MKVTEPTKLAVAWLTMFTVGTELFVFSPLLPTLAVDYHISASTAGLSVTIFSLSYMLSAPLLGHLSDRIGRRRVLIWCLAAFAAANLLTASAADLPLLLAVRLFGGAAAAGIAPSIYALVSSAAAPARRATWLALVVSGLLMSLTFGASGGTLVAGCCGWRTIFIGLAGLSMALAWLNWRVWPRDRGTLDIADTATAGRMAVVLARRLIPTVVWSTGLYAVYIYLGTGLAAAGYSAGQTAQAILIYGCGAIFGVFIGGRAADRFGVRFTGGASFAGLCACLLVLRAALDTGVLVIPAIGVSSAVAQLFFPAQQAGLAADFPAQRSAALAWNNSALFLGISLGSLVGGQVVALRDFDATLLLSAAIALIGWGINAVVVPGRVLAATNGVKGPQQSGRTLKPGRWLF
jgi:predicted MFS family arabinose efflux permease